MKLPKNRGDWALSCPSLVTKRRLQYQNWLTSIELVAKPLFSGKNPQSSRERDESILLWPFDLFRRCQAMTAQTDWEWHLPCLKASAMFFASPSTFPCTETSCFFFPTFSPHLTPTPASLGEFSSWDLY